MENVRFGIAGLGNMGAAHAHQLLAGKIPRAELTAVADVVAAKLAPFSSLQRFEDAEMMFASGAVDAVLIATPHYAHTTLGIAALERGLHVMVEKPISVHKADCERLLAAHAGREGQVFAAMFNQRTDPYYQRIRSLIQQGELGEVRRINWIVTNWFRTHAYYASGGWRATWAGEGGGVLLNQCPHNLDLWQWLFTMPTTVHAFCRFGHAHPIEVEDDVTAYMEYANGASGVFITTTGETPGTNRLEVTGERGKLVYENDRLAFTRNEVEMTLFSRTTPLAFATPPTWEVSIPVLPLGHGEQHNGILKNFVDAILDGAPLLAPAAEGIHSVELANAMLLSTFTGETVTMPLDGAAYERKLAELIAGSKKKTAVVEGPATDFSQSFR